jgi:hypothetical protein
MTQGTLITILQQYAQLAPKSRIYFAMRGEPTLHPSFNTMIALTRFFLPEAMIVCITNGVKLTKTMARRFFADGGNCLMIDTYGNSRPAIHKRLAGVANEIDYGDIRSEDGFSVWNYQGTKCKNIVWVADMSDYSNKTNRTFTNQCDAINPQAYEKYGIPKITAPLPKNCASPSRDLSVHYNGDFPVCCKDWVGSRVLYNINTDRRTLAEYWYKDEALQAIRQLLGNKNRAFQPCQRCNYNGGFRLGFLPTQPVLTIAQQRQMQKRLRNAGMHEVYTEVYKHKTGGNNAGK